MRNTMRHLPPTSLASPTPATTAKKQAALRAAHSMQQLAQQLKAHETQQPGGKSSEAAKELAQMLRQMAQGKSGQRSGDQSAQSMQGLMAALENMTADLESV